MRTTPATTAARLPHWRRRTLATNITTRARATASKRRTPPHVVPEDQLYQGVGIVHCGPFLLPGIDEGSAAAEDHIANPGKDALVATKRPEQRRQTGQANLCGTGGAQEPQETLRSGSAPEVLGR